MERIINYNLTDNFIERLADFIDENFIRQGKDLSKLAIVFGGRRPALFLKKELSRKIKKGFLSPHFFSIDEFVEYALSKKETFSKIPDLDACFIIYKLSQELAADILKERDSFSRFLPWAREILNFIEQLDLEDIRAESLKNIQEKAGIGYDVPENINALLKDIISIRDAYHAALKKKKAYSRGLQYLACSQYIREIDFSEFSQMLFCGFFYWHKTESNIIRHLYDSKKATLIFQGVDFEWGALKPQERQKPNYELSIQCGHDLHCEVGLVKEILKKARELDSTVIVLPEPDNIIPLVSEISGEVEEFNVSMGYPLKRAALYSLFESTLATLSSLNFAAIFSASLFFADALLVLSALFFANKASLSGLLSKLRRSAW